MGSLLSNVFPLPRYTRARSKGHCVRVYGKSQNFATKKKLSQNVADVQDVHTDAGSQTEHFRVGFFFPPSFKQERDT